MLLDPSEGAGIGGLPIFHTDYNSSKAVVHLGYIAAYPGAKRVSDCYNLFINQHWMLIGGNMRIIIWISFQNILHWLL